jgi:hypothetical protein
MASSDVEICQKALALLGSEQIQSLEEENDRAQICNLIYPELKQSALSETHWNFATEKAQLAQLSGEPVSEYDYEYNLPSDMVSGPHKVLTDNDAQSPIQSWEIVGGNLMTDYDEIYIDYTADVDETRMPPYFVRFLYTALAAELAKSITDQTTTAQFYKQKAYGTASDNESGGLLGKAKLIDSSTQATQVIDDNPIHDARFDP